jgi:hypothetical protein
MWLPIPRCCRGRFPLAGSLSMRALTFLPVGFSPTGFPKPGVLQAGRKGTPRLQALCPDNRYGIIASIRRRGVAAGWTR